ncbi:MAG: condensation domain-containing protein [Actinomycetota bacterium]|nr:condensation domain-containing protein [Actinomycetota bacterium]
MGGREAADALASVALSGNGGGRSRGAIPRRSVASPPASLIQQRVWRFHHLAPDNPAYNIAGAVRLEGPLDVASLARAVHEVSLRHESLRTTFALRDGELIQVVIEEPTQMEQLDLTTLPRAEGYDEGLALVDQKSRQAFDLVQGPLFRMSLMTLDEEDHLLFFGMHHIISDGWSVGVLQRDLRELYRAHSTGTVPKLPRLEIQYADFAVWQSDRLARGELDDQLEFWLGELEGAPRTLLSTDRPRPAIRTFAGSSLDLRLDPELGMRLKSLMHRLNVTPFAVLLSAFSAVLQAESGADDMVIGTPVAGRGHLDLEHLIGLFLNVIPLRLKLSQQSSFEKLVMTTRDSIMDAFMNQDVPFPEIADRLDPQPDDARPALFQVVFNMINTPGGRFELPGLRTSLVLPSQVSAKQDMTLYAIEDAGSFAFELVYNSGLFVEERVAAVLEKFLRVLEEAARDATRPIGHILDAASAQAPLG